MSEPSESDQGADLSVPDPDDYHRTQKLKTIHQARRNVQKIHRNKRSNMDRYEGWDSAWYDVYHKELAEAVASYGHEVLPIVEEAHSEGVIDESEVTDPSGRHIAEFVANEGLIKEEGDHFTAPDAKASMSIYRQLDRILRQVGLGVSLEEGEETLSL
jgi:hypothetical protein